MKSWRCDEKRMVVVDGQATAEDGTLFADAIDII